MTTEKVVFFNEEECKHLGHQFDQQPERVGEACFRILIDRHLSIRQDMNCLLKFDPSAWDVIDKEPELFLNLPDGAKLAYILLRPAFCETIDASTLMRMKNITIPRPCFEKISPLVLESLDWNQLFSLADKSPYDFEKLESAMESAFKLFSVVYERFISNETLIKLGPNNLPFTNYVNKLVDSLQSKDPDFYTSFQSACQIIGDSLISKKSVRVLDRNLELEGNGQDLLYPIVLRHIESLMKDDKNPIYSDIYDKLKKAVFLAKLMTLYEDQDSYVNLFYAKFLKTSVSKLKTGDSLIVPHGFYATEGHATVCEFVSLSEGEVLINYYNTGDGINYHAVHTNPENVLNSKRCHKLTFIVPVKELTLQWWNLFLAIKCRKKDKGSNWTAADIYKGLFSTFPVEYLKKELDEKDIFITGQLSGTCTFKSLLTWMRTRFASDSDYQEFKIKMKRQSFVSLLDYKILFFSRKGVEMAIHLAEEIEKDAENAFMAHIGKEINGRKRELVEKLKEIRTNPSKNQEFVEISESELPADNPELEKILPKVSDWLNFKNISHDSFPSLGSFAQNIEFFCYLLTNGIVNRNILNFILEDAVTWDMEKGEFGDMDCVNLYVLVTKIYQLVWRLDSVTDNFDYKERRLTVCLLTIQAWLAFIKLYPNASEFRPYLQRSHATNWKYNIVDRKISSWSEGFRIINILDRFKLDGTELFHHDHLFHFAKIFFDESKAKDFIHCKGRTKGMIEKNYIGPALIFSPTCAPFYFVTLSEYESIQELYVGAFGTVMRIIKQAHDSDYISTEREFMDVSDKYFQIYRYLNFRRPVSSAPDFCIVQNYWNASNNDIMAASSDKSSKTSTKIKKMATVLKKLNGKVPQFMLIAFISSRPLLMQRLDVVDALFKSLFKDSYWQEDNLAHSWLKAFDFILRFHSIMYSGTHDIKFLKGFQNSILACLNLSHFQTEILEKKRMFVALLSSHLEAYSNFYNLLEKDRKSFIHPFLFQSFSEFLDKNFVNFAAYYLAADRPLSELAGFSRSSISLKTFDDMFATALHDMQSEATCENMEKVASLYRTLHGSREVIHETSVCKGQFPMFKINHVGYIDLLRGVVSKEPPITSSFKAESVVGLKEFCDFNEFFGDLNNMKKTVSDVNYEFVQTSSSEYRLSLISNGKRFILFDEYFKHTKLFLSNKLYSAWCSKDECLLKRVHKNLALEHVHSFPWGPIYPNTNTILHNYFPAELIMTTYDGHLSYVILNFENPFGDQLKVSSKNGKVCIGEYCATAQDLKKRKDMIYNLDVFPLLVLQNNNSKYGFLPEISSKLLEWSTITSRWVFGRDFNNQHEMRFLTKAIRTHFVPLDDDGHLLPSNTLEIILVSFYYLAAGEYSLSLSYLTTINQTTQFDEHEMRMLQEMINFNDNFPSAISVELYANWILFMNFRLFNCASPSQNDLQNDEQLKTNLLTKLTQYLALEGSVPRNAKVLFSESDPHESVLSYFETQALLKEYSAFIPSVTLIYEPYNEKDHSSDVLSYEKIAYCLSSLIVPRIEFSHCAKKVMDFMGDDAFSTEDFCSSLRHSGLARSFDVGRDIQMRCNTKLNSLSSPADAWSYSFVVSHAKVEYYKRPALPIEDMKIASLKEKFFVEYEKEKIEKYSSAIEDILNSFNSGFIKINVDDNCDENSSFIEFNACKGEAALMKLDQQRKYAVNFLNLRNREELKSTIRKTIEAMKKEISNLLESFTSSYGLFTDTATSFVDFTEKTWYTDQTLMKFIRDTPFYMFKRYFSSEQEPTQLAIQEYFFLRTQVQRFTRVLEMLQITETESKDFLSIADDIIVELSSRPIMEPFNIDIVLFEYAHGMRLRNENITALGELLQHGVERKQNVVLQKMMGSGKTLVLGALSLLNAQKDEFSMFISLSSLLKMNANNTLSSNLKAFGQKGHFIQITRCYHINGSLKHCVSFLSSIHSILRRCIEKKEYIMISKESLLSLYNTFKEAAIQKAMIEEFSEVHCKSQMIIELLKTSGFAIIDEVDSVLFPYFELNYPLTEQTAMNQLLSKTIISVFSLLSTNAELIEIYDVREYYSPPIFHSTYEKLIELLKAKLQRDEYFIKCMENDDGSGGCCKSQFERFLSSVLPDCLKSILNVMYGPAHEINDMESLVSGTAIMYAKPYEGSNRPSKASEFSDFVTSLTYTLLMYLKQGLGTAVRSYLFKRFIKDAESEFFASASKILKDSEGDVNGLDFTETGKMLSNFCGIENAISEYNSNPDSKSIAQCFSNERLIGMTLLFVERIVAPTISYSEKQISSNPQNLFYMLKRYIAYSGTIENKNVFSSSAEIKTDDIALGKIMNQVLSKKSRLYFMKNGASLTEIYKFLETQNGTSLVSRISAFIDVAAVFNESSNYDLVQESMRALNLEGGFYFKTGTDDLFFTDRNENVKFVDKTDCDSLHQASGLNVSKRFTFYDDVHSRGVDICQAPDSVAIVTVRASTSLSKLLQGILRMRKIFGSQEVVFLMISDDIEAAEILLEKQSSHFDALDILNMTFLSEQKNLMNENQTVLLQKISSYLDDHILQSHDLSDYLKVSNLEQLEMMGLSFDQKFERYFYLMKGAIQKIPLAENWINAEKMNWSSKIVHNDLAKNLMTNLNEKEVKKQKEVLNQNEIENEMEQLDFTTELSPGMGYKSLTWSKWLFEIINHEKVTNLYRSEPELISWNAINSELPSLIEVPANIYFSSNFVQVVQGDYANASFKMHVKANVDARRDQLPFFIAVFPSMSQKDKYSVVFLEPSETADFISSFKRQHFSDVKILSSNGDLVYPESDVGNIFASRGKPFDSTWNAQVICELILRAAYAMGMHEMFSNFELAYDLRTFESHYSENKFNSNALLSVDQEVDKMSILKDVLLSTLDDQKIQQDWHRHLSIVYSDELEKEEIGSK